MAQEIQSDVEAFVRELQRFHDSLPQAQQGMLDAILLAAQEATETSGYMMPNAYMTEFEAKDRMATRLREAEHDRLVRQARQGNAEEQSTSAVAAHRFDWLYSWLPAIGARPQQA
jgi:hypothetical protein